jgi:two-component system chemotaxis response regulator CheB
VPKIRILVVDDAIVFRRLVSDELARDPALEVVGTAANGRIALARMSQVNPDLVILDVEMPELDGLATLAELRRTYPRLPVIMFSALTERGAEATLDALALGATDYFTKPTSAGGPEASLAVIREQLIPKIKTLCMCEGRLTGSRFIGSRTDKSEADKSPLAPRPSPLAPRSSPGPVEVVAIGASTGGPNALAEIFTRLPADFPVPLVMVQHMPPMFTRLLAERLSAQYALRVQEGCSGGVLQPGRAWIAPGDYHLSVVRNGTQVRLLVHQDPPENSCRPAVDVLLRSVARAFGPNALAVILTGMGQDGLRGCEAVREAGGQILAQDEATSVVWGMPGYVARAGLADRVLPLSLIADEILRRVRSDKGSR